MKKLRFGNEKIMLNLNFSISLSNLYMKSEQYYRIKGKGLSKIKQDIYDVLDKNDIIVKIKIL